MPPLTSPQTVKGAGFLLRARWGREGGRVIYMKPMSHLPGETPPPPHTSMASIRPLPVSSPTLEVQQLPVSLVQNSSLGALFSPIMR